MKKPSKNQIDMVNRIVNVLGIDFPQSQSDFTAKKYWEFTQKHINDYYAELDYSSDNSYNDLFSFGRCMRLEEETY